MARGGREKEQDDPERKCIVSGESQPKAGLVRFCIGPDNMVVPDILGRLPGRGIYVAADRAAIDKAAAKGLFSRAARQPVKAPDALSDLIEAQLLRQLGHARADVTFRPALDMRFRGQAYELPIGFTLDELGPGFGAPQAIG